ncbi:ferrichrome-iron receptor [Yersinia massiliensis]|uniref:Ferrichrome-iron receptor n=1 Tax=Yersinia massiliensis TaxID=419257 RepID=A0ABM6UZ28_9GAMM|nr:ferrichrome-iron receptor [Yersinia massiliensis]
MVSVFLLSSLLAASAVALVFLTFSAVLSDAVAAHADADSVPSAAPIMTHRIRGASRF